MIEQVIECCRLTRTTDPAGGNTDRAYDVRGQLTKLTDPAGNASTLAYDALGRRTKAIDAALNEVRQAYDAIGRVTSSTRRDYDGAAYSEYVTWAAYDAANRLTKTTAQGPDGTIGNGDDQVASFLYDDTGLRTRATDALARTTDSHYDEAGRLTRQIEDSGGLARTTDYYFDLAGRQTAITAHPVPGDGTKDQTTAYAYDLVGRLTRTTYPDATPNTVDRWFDAAGNVTKRKDQRASYLRTRLGL